MGNSNDASTGYRLPYDIACDSPMGDGIKIIKLLRTVVPYPFFQPRNRLVRHQAYSADPRTISAPSICAASKA